MGNIRRLNILTVNRHTGYLYNLSRIGHHWLVLAEWEQYNRPLPANFELVDWAQARRSFHNFDAVVGHDIRRDLWRFLPYCLRYHKPYFQVIHGRRARGGFSRSQLRRFAKQLYSGLVLRPLANLGLIRIVFISPYARSDWGLKGTTIDQGIPLDEMGPYTGTEASLLVVGNTLHREHFGFEELMQIRAQVPVRIVGVNPNIPGCRPSKDWEELRSLYSRNRAYLNLTREPEAGHNLALLEAMASGMPVISLKHPSTPIRNGENGFLVGTVSEAVERAKQLLADCELARRLGKCARDTIEREFSLKVFSERWNELLVHSIGATTTPDAP
ncbi:MAG TPA: glycosyltransferase [Terriglobia bacterium]|nr:glycosyltransferase [Terriglobia bacterium]